MRKLILSLAAAAALAAAIAPPSNAAENVNCSSVPKSEWAQCIIDQAASQGGD